MATRKTSTDRPDPAAQLQETLAQTVQGAAERLQSLNLTGTAASLLESGRKDIEALVEANKRSFQGLQTVVQRQTEMLRQSVTEWQGAISQMKGQDVSSNLGKLDDMGKAAFQQALSDIRELAEVAAKSQADAFNVVRERINENVEQVSKLLQSGDAKKK